MKMCQWLSGGSWVVGGSDTVVQRASDHCNVIIKHRQAILLESIPPIDRIRNMRGKIHLQSMRVLSAA